MTKSISTQEGAAAPHASTSAAGSREATKSPSKGESHGNPRRGEKGSSSGKRRKVGQACIYCRRSHMTCDDSRPCKRCIKRDIGHLCHDETPSRPSHPSSRSESPTSAQRQQSGSLHLTQSAGSPLFGREEDNSGYKEPSATATATGLPSIVGGKSRPSQLSGIDPQGSNASFTGAMQPPSQLAASNFNPTNEALQLPPELFTQSVISNGYLNNWGAASMLGGAGFLGLGGAGPSGIGDGSSFLASGDAAGGNEFNILSEFLESLDGTSAVPTPAAVGGDVSSQQMGHRRQSDAGQGSNGAPYSAPTPSSSAAMQNLATSTSNTRSLHARNRSQGASLQDAAALAANSKTETFFLTAADQKDGSRDERLGRVIQAKLDAGLLRPYNHVKGYARLNQWMEQNCSQVSRRRILKPLSVFRPAFRAIAQSLTNLDLIYIEEAFERLLLDYDRVFSTQGIPACLWRRTGEIYKGNKEFADLVGVSVEALREGKCAIYELMQEDSAVNYWEKYGAVCFDPGQKAVLTSCVLTTRRARRRQGSQTSGAPSQATNGAGSESHNGTGKGQPPSSSRENDEKSGKGLSGQEDAAPTQSSNGANSGLLSCCFSFTIRRDAWGIPYAIIGNFVPIPEPPQPVSTAPSIPNSTRAASAAAQPPTSTAQPAASSQPSSSPTQISTEGRRRKASQPRVSNRNDVKA